MLDVISNFFLKVAFCLTYTPGEKYVTSLGSSGWVDHRLGSAPEWAYPLPDLHLLRAGNLKEVQNFLGPGCPWNLGKVPQEDSNYLTAGIKHLVRAMNVCGEGAAGRESLWETPGWLS